MRLILILFLLLSLGSASSYFDVGFNLDIDEPIDLYNGNEKRKDKSKGLQDFQPISNTIVQSETQYYSFNVNTSSGLGSYYELLILLTGNICSEPSNVKPNETSLAVYYSFNASMFQNLEISQMALFNFGYFQAWADVPASTQNENRDSILYIAVRAPQNTNSTAVWTYEIGVSQNNLVFQWDDRTWASLVDSDDHSALIVTGNLTTEREDNFSSFNATNSQYSLSIYSYDYLHYFDALNSSWCAIRNGPALMSNFESSYTTRSGALQQQFYVDGLNSSTKYIAYLVSDFNGNNFGGVAYRAFEFETMDDSSCQLIYDLEFCDQVAYAVPASSGFTRDELAGLYDGHASSLYTNFSKALQQVACNTTKDAIFSPVTTCDNCAESYKNWLCAVTIPRCSTRDIKGYREANDSNSRNKLIDNYIKPELSYYEVLPCVNVCQAIVKDCPSSFGFQCPNKNDSIRLSYYWDEGGNYPTCNYVGKIVTPTSWASSLIINWRLFLLMLVLYL